MLYISGFVDDVIFYHKEPNTDTGLELAATLRGSRPTQNPLKFVGVPQTNETMSAASRPKFTILSGRVEEILPLNEFFSDFRYMPQLRRYSPTKLCDGAQMAIFGDFFASCVFS